METIGLNLLTKQRMTKLLENPLAKSKTFSTHQSKQISNCHSTMSYIFNLDAQPAGEILNQNLISGNEMKNLISKYFISSENFEIGNLVGFYKNLNSKDEILLHTALLMGPNLQIFHQSGIGGIFEVKTIKEKLKSLNLFEPEKIQVKSFKLK